MSSAGVVQLASNMRKLHRFCRYASARARFTSVYAKSLGILGTDPRISAAMEPKDIYTPTAPNRKSSAAKLVLLATSTELAE